MRSLRSVVAAAVPLLCGSAAADVTVELGTITIPAGTETHTLQVHVSGGDALTDFVGRFQVADGGALYGGSIDGPKITAIEFGGSIWSGAAGGFAQFASASYPTQVQEISASLTDAGETVSANGILCTLTLDTAGYSGSFDLKVTGTLAGNTSFRNGAVTVAGALSNGSLVFGDPTAAPPQLGIEFLNDGATRISIPSEIGRTYDIQWSPNLLPGSWTPLSLDLPGTGTDIPWIDDGTLTLSLPSASGARFYRAIAN